jgi:hypothetical protein
MISGSDRTKIGPLLLLEGFPVGLGPPVVEGLAAATSKEVSKDDHALPLFGLVAHDGNLMSEADTEVGMPVGLKGEQPDDHTENGGQGLDR